MAAVDNAIERHKEIPAHVAVRGISLIQDNSQHLRRTAPAMVLFVVLAHYTLTF